MTVSTTAHTTPTRRARTRREWAVLATGVVVLVALCLLAGRWQWNRYVSREAEIERIETNYSAPAVPLEAVVDSGENLDPSDVWRPATLRGQYVVDATVLLRNRPVDGQVGYHVLVPFEVTAGPGEGTILVVDRGLVPLGADATSAVAVPAPPGGTVEATVTLRADEPSSGRDAPTGQVNAISTAQVLAAGPDGADWAAGRTVGAYGQIRAEDPAPDQAPLRLPRPDTDPGSHLSYAFQWCVFALGAVGGFLLLVRRDRRDRLGVAVTAGDLLAAEAPEAVRARRRRGPTAEEEEDALIDAQLPGDVHRPGGTTTPNAR